MINWSVGQPATFAVLSLRVRGVKLRCRSIPQAQGRPDIPFHAQLFVVRRSFLTIDRIANAEPGAGPGPGPGPDEAVHWSALLLFIISQILFLLLQVRQASPTAAQKQNESRITDRKVSIRMVNIN